ncbi:hypothetical protein BU25DRAFT_31669 [Macroventuria anomochaeta]|uniref:Uncharacterized protein n=1 Tax=Macroventuria anomochaeta TaxID=301207 RepID=A0ACB6S3L3_9PLEO|nr:uncharacterized protein BU25DRAFT_31669 [Macroventuria anomochaeta]KAF2628756.1 hypothetical protein BU25DRAFT_31669 [Macroventuria anomochaeta]
MSAIVSMLWLTAVSARFLNGRYILGAITPANSAQFFPLHQLYGSYLNTQGADWHARDAGMNLEFV